MSIILIGGQKGGIGKSTIACNLSAVLVSQSRDVMLVDADKKQASSSAWWAERTQHRHDLPHIACVQKDGFIDRTLMDFNDRYDYVIVDCAGRDSEELRSAMAVADILITPTKASQIDLMTLSTMAMLIRKCTASVNKDLVSYCCINIAPTNPKIAEVEQAMVAIKDYPEFVLMNTVIYDRKLYRDSMAEGCGVIEVPARASASAKLAKQEILALTKEVLHGI